MGNKQENRIKHIFQFMDYDFISEAEHNLVISFEEQFLKSNSLSKKQTDILETIFKRSSERDNRLR